MTTTTTIIIVIICKCGGMSWRYSTYCARRGIRVHRRLNGIRFQQSLGRQKTNSPPPYCTPPLRFRQSFVVTRGRGRRIHETTAVEVCIKERKNFFISKRHVPTINVNILKLIFSNAIEMFFLPINKIFENML